MEPEGPALDHFPRKIIALWNLAIKLRSRYQHPNLLTIQINEKLLLGAFWGMENRALKHAPFDPNEKAVQLLREMDRYILTNRHDQKNSSVVIGKLMLLSQHRQIVRMKRDERVSRSLQQALNNLACLYRSMTNLPRALHLLSRAEKLQPSLASNRSRLVTVMNKAAVLSSMGLHERALMKLRQCKVLADLSDDVELEADLLYNMGVEFEHLRLGSTAIRNYRAAFTKATSEEMKSKAHEAILAYNAAHLRLH